MIFSYEYSKFLEHRLSRPQLMIYLLLKELSATNGKVKMRLIDISRILGMCTPSIWKDLMRLVSVGLIEKTKRKAPLSGLWEMEYKILTKREE